MSFRILIQPVFSNGIPDYTFETEYGDLPSYVQNEVISYFQSKEFIKDQIEGYVVNDLMEGPLQSNDAGTYPRYDGKVTNLSFSLSGKVLNLILEITLIQKQSNDTVYMPLTYNTLLENIKEGLWKASHSGPLVSKYGTYLGDDEGKRYMIYFETKRIFIGK